MRKINKTKILKTATELKKRISSKKVALQLSVSHGKRVFEGGWCLRGTGEKGKRTSWSGGSEETLRSSSWWLFSWLPSLSCDLVDAVKPLPKPMQNPRSLLDNFGVLSRNLKGLEVSPKLKASSIFWNTDGVATVFKEEEKKQSNALLKGKRTQNDRSPSPNLVPLYFFCLVGIKIDRQIQVDKHTWIYINTQRFTREREREREREIFYIYIRQSSLSICLIILRRNEMEICCIMTLLRNKDMIGSIIFNI